MIPAGVLSKELSSTGWPDFGEFLLEKMVICLGQNKVAIMME